jgi:hypothetical protein
MSHFQMTTLNVGRAISPLLFGLALLLPYAALADDILLGMTRGEVHVLPAGRAIPIVAGKG